MVYLRNRNGQRTLLTNNKRGVRRTDISYCKYTDRNIDALGCTSDDKHTHKPYLYCINRIVVAKLSLYYTGKQDKENNAQIHECESYTQMLKINLQTACPGDTFLHMYVGTCTHPMQGMSVICRVA